MRDLNNNYIQELDTYDECLTPDYEEQICEVCGNDDDVSGTCDDCGRDYCSDCEGSWVGYQCCKWCAE